MNSKICCLAKAASIYYTRRVRKGAFPDSRAMVMTNRKYAVLTRVTGVVFLLIWLYYLAILVTSTISYYRDPAVHTLLTVGISPKEFEALLRTLIQGKGLVTITSISWGLFVGFLAIIHLLRLRSLGRYLTMIISVDMLVIIVFSSWVSGSYVYSLFWPAIAAITSALVIWFFSRRHTRAQFRTDGTRSSLGTRLLIGFYAFFLVVKLLSVPAFIGFLSIKHQEIFRTARLVPQKAEYVISDSTYLKNECTKQEIFGYTVWLPDYMKVLTATREKDPPWHMLWLRGIDGGGNRVLINMTDEAYGQLLLPFMDGQQYRFKSAYELERAFSYPSWSPDWILLKSAALSLDSIEDATSSGWKGFVKLGPWTDGVNCTIISSMYDSTDEYSAEITIIFNQESMTIDQVKSILASLRFEKAESDTESFERGLSELGAKQLMDASISFLNAFYLDPDNPEYAYYFAQSLLEDTSKTYRKRYLRLSKRFLEYSLELDSAYVQAVELLPQVNDELTRIEAEESKQSSVGASPQQPADRDRDEVEE